ncbi:S-layer domain-containing protein [Gottschalkia purinilytica]|uniref:S-layer domain-containing protein n=1 Tax=Gottschalkia purinilytica TaxID=1503 RepID=A0A0L0WA15_GOTPU|nr:S-layer homology domain-containing protein [Gottschalkia purinilytica]KNF08145.1 S-layer domain-containing protein [Gottschalkia purinilytica]
MKTKSIIISLALSIILSISMLGTAIAQNSTTTVSRLDFVKKVIDSNKIELVKESKSSFEDVKGEKDIQYVQTAYKKGLISGYGNKFNPNDPITKEQVVIVVVKSLVSDSTVQKFTGKDFNDTVQFTDKNNVSGWAKPYITYAVKNNLIDYKGNFNPKSNITLEEINKILDNAKSLYNTVLTREGLTASQLFEKSSEEMNKLSSYKFKSEGTSSSKVSSIENGKEEVQQSTSIDVVNGIFEKPGKFYASSVSKANSNGENVEIKQEVLISEEDKILYMKSDIDPENDKWIKIDLNPILDKIGKLSSKTNLGDLTSINNNLDLAKQQELFGSYVKYGEDVVVDGQKYYTIDLDLDNETFKKITSEISNTVIDSLFDEIAKADPDNQELSKDEFKSIFNELLNSMDISTKYKYYINKDTKLVDISDVKQNVSMKNNFSTEGNDVSVNITTNSDIKLKFFDFNKPVKFPKIDKKDVVNIEDAFKISDDAETEGLQQNIINNITGVNIPSNIFKK